VLKKAGAKKAENLKWTDELAEELHKPVVKKFRKRKVYVKGIDEILAADLIKMQVYSDYNDSVKYLLTVIDIFSKHGWMVPLKQKTGAAVAAAFQSIFNGGRTPKKLWVDKGKEFYNKDVKSSLESKSCSLYSTENEEKSCVVERWNRTMKEEMFKYFSANSTRKYLDVLDEMVTNYNKTWHSLIKMTPSEASLKKNEAAVYRNLYPDHNRQSSKPKFKIGDMVRITKKKKCLRKHTHRSG